MAVQKPTQRRFAVMGENAFNMANKIMQNQNICRLLKYQVKDPFNTDKYQDVDGVLLLNKQIMITPKIWDEDTEKTSYIVALFDTFTNNLINPDFKIDTLSFDIACPYDEWILNGHSLRPYLLMQEIDQMFNGAEMAGIGTLQFVRADRNVFTSQIGGYTMKYSINEFN